MKMNREALKQINNIVDYKQTQRIKLDVILSDDNRKNDYYLLFSDQVEINYQGHHRQIGYDDIKEIHLSMGSRIYNQGVIESNPAKWFVKIWQTGAVGTVWINLNYFIDFDIVLNDDVILIENNSIYNGAKIIEFLKDKEVKVIDPYGIEAMLLKYPDKMKLVEHLNQIFPQLAKQYHLDNPRGVEAIK